MAKTQINEASVYSANYVGIKGTVKRVLPKSFWRTISNKKKKFLLKKIFKLDQSRFERSINDDSLEKLEFRLLLCTHALEKGLSHNSIRYGYGSNGLKNLSEIVKSWTDKGYSEDNEVFQNALSMISSYIELHKNVGYSVDFLNEYFEREFLNKAKEYKKKLAGYKYFNFKENYSSFSEFVEHRSSIREFSEKGINTDEIYEAVKVAQKSPSSCNRQSSRTRLILDSEKIEKILNLQNGLRGYKLPPALIVTTVDMVAYSNIEDRNLGYIDGGLFTMTLLYALTENKIGSCLLNTCFSEKNEMKMRELISMRDSEIFINIIPIGKLDKDTKVCISHRIDTSKIIKIID